MPNPQDYPVFEQWYRATDWLLDKCEKMPKDVRFTLSNRIGNLALDILEGITEAIYTKERSRMLNKLNLMLEKLRLLLRLSHDRRYLSTAQLGYISKEIHEVGSMLGGWLNPKDEKNRISV